MRLIDADALIPTQVHTVVVLKDGREQLESVLYAEQVDDAPTVEPTSPWHRVENGLPEESKEYIVYLQMGTGVEAPDCLGKVDLSYVTSMYFKKEKGIWFDEYDESYNGDLSLVDTVNDYHVTHWMPFPEPPKEDA